MAIKNQKKFKKMLFFKIGLALVTLFLVQFEAKMADRVESSEIILDHNNKKIPSGYAKLKGETLMSSIDMVEAKSGSSFSKKLVLKFNRLKGFQSSSKQAKGGKVIHELVFDGLDDKGFDLGRLRQGLAKMTLYEAGSPAFERFSIKPIGRKTGDRSYIPQLRLLIESSPEKVFVKVGQEAGVREVEIEVFDKSRLKKIASHNNSNLKYAFGGHIDQVNQVEPERALVVFSGQKLASHDLQVMSGKAFDNIFSCAKQTFSQAGISVSRASCRSKGSKADNVWLAGGIGADLTVYVQLGAGEDGRPKLTLSADKFGQNVEKPLEVGDLKSMAGKTADSGVSQGCQDFFQKLICMA